ncbi:MAG: helix-turn-helix transcriptional regulator [Bradyrhizobium sp.]|uniref:helix-turn-helix transcriptional regulator n=1 Tax=Bradyrhizobium sp. TaxID=376 RepID=UPI0027281D6A|nr:helix-turn-helix transcriptional regulator [Bradyrhizobium sp.]MDO9561475.1 helix-turn-helix transcriptional regulator [Bradyrhizobium sp.]MDP3692699.1 helix-turn-helix transcriptional regulator [Bradyrhizobium sp.]
MESTSTESELIDRIYECGFVPELWPQVLKDTSKISESAGASLFITNPEVTAWTASKNSREITGRFVADGWYWQGRLMSLVHESRHAGFLRDVDLCSQEELEAEPIYRDNWRKMGLGWGAATAFALPTGENLSIVLSRTTAQGPADAATIQRLDTLRPHLARTAVMAARLHLERAQAAGQALAALGLAALVLDESGKVLAANALIEGLDDLVYWRAADRVTLKDRRADDMLGEALARVALNDHGGARSFPVRDATTDALMVGHVIPIRFSARDIFASSAAVFVLMPVGAPNAPPVELVMSLFDLTPAEARVARGLAAGKTVDDLAGDNGVSPNTVRVQVRGVLEKTGCRRQTEVVALLGGISVQRIDPP